MLNGKYEERHKYKLCYRQFSCGRELRGHRKSHLATLPLPPPKKPQKQQSCGGGCNSTEIGKVKLSQLGNHLGEDLKGKCLWVKLMMNWNCRTKRKKMVLKPNSTHESLVSSFLGGGGEKMVATEVVVAEEW
ncbi:hypothetical protein M9H77_12408 [Catharanthus roseus]|uniref:Uncharacterized protein n=1 Tax=Catharanthus roseus TaxID=4058 RepID=A0ACC0BHB4_CATRO|nr:hypothetical protein M9H77_12408 [Catharanthus roseus]